jgi:polyisoprenoid-binding protein YceI
LHNRSAQFIKETFVKHFISTLALAGIVIGASAQPIAAQNAGVTSIQITEGKGRFKIAERMVGIDTGNDATGTTEAITGVIVLKADGSIDSSQSKITVDLKSLKSDQQMRDMYVQGYVLQTEKFPTLEFVPTKAIGLPFPLPMGKPLPGTPIKNYPEAAAFKLVGNMTLHGVTKEVTWNVVSTINNDTVSGQASTAFQFGQFNMTKPSVPLLASVEDNIRLEVEFRTKRTN